MRTTLTIDDDVASALERLQRTRDASFKELVNEALRRGLREMAAKPRRRNPFRTKAMDLGRPLVDNIDSIADTLAIAEGEHFK